MIWDFIGFPLRTFLLNEDLQLKFRLTTLKNERINAVIPFIKGRVIDMGCCKNSLIKKYRDMGGDGLGFDVFPFDGVDVVVDSLNLPFNNAEFNTAVLLGSLNHIPSEKRVPVLKELYRVLSNDGRLLITMINPLVGLIIHKVAWWDEDQNERGINKNEENYGLRGKYVIDAAFSSGFKLILMKKFVYGLNNLFYFEKI